MKKIMIVNLKKGSSQGFLNRMNFGITNPVKTYKIFMGLKSK